MSTKTPLDFVVLSDAVKNFFVEEIAVVDGVEVERIVDITPFYDHDGDSGMRLYVLEDIELRPFEKVIIPHGIGVRPPAGFETQIRPRSSAFPKKDCLCVLGTVDQPYGGEISSVVMYMPKPMTLELPSVARCDDGCCHTPSVEFIAFPIESLWLRKGDRVSQLVLVKVETADVTRRDSLPETSRGSGGWGSTDRGVRL